MADSDSEPELPTPPEAEHPTSPEPVELTPWIRELMLQARSLSSPRMGQLLDVLQEADADVPGPSSAPRSGISLLVSDGSYSVRCLVMPRALSAADWEKEFWFRGAEGILLLLRDCEVRVQVESRVSAEFYLQVNKLSLLPASQCREWVPNCNKDPEVRRKLYECLEEYLSEATPSSTGFSLTQLLSEEQEQEPGQGQGGMLMRIAESCLVPSSCGTKPCLTRWDSLRLRTGDEEEYTVPSECLHIPKFDQLILTALEKEQRPKTGMQRQERGTQLQKTITQRQERGTLRQERGTQRQDIGTQCQKTIMQHQERVTQLQERRTQRQERGTQHWEKALQPESGVPPGSALRSHSWRCSGDPMGCQESNPGPKQHSSGRTLRDLPLTLTLSSASCSGTPPLPGHVSPGESCASVSLLPVLPPSRGTHSPPLSCTPSLSPLRHSGSPQLACVTRTQKTSLCFKEPELPPKAPQPAASPRTSKGASEPNPVWTPPQRHRDGSAFQYTYDPPCASLCAQVQATRLPSRLLAWAVFFLTESQGETEQTKV